MSAVYSAYPSTYRAATATPARHVSFGERDYASCAPVVSPTVPAALAGVGTGIVMALAGVFRKMPLAAAGAAAVAGTSLMAYNAASQKQAEQCNNAAVLNYLA